MLSLGAYVGLLRGVDGTEAWACMIPEDVDGTEDAYAVAGWGHSCRCLDDGLDGAGRSIEKSEMRSMCSSILLPSYSSMPKRSKSMYAGLSDFMMINSRASSRVSTCLNFANNTLITCR